MRKLAAGCLVIAFVGCKGEEGGGKADLRAGPRDLAEAAEDMATEQLGATGDPCMKGPECGGQAPKCRTSSTVPWPEGYCTSTCTTSQNDPDTELNPKCPGDNGTCVSGACETACTHKDGENPCLRDGYVCFFSCRPKELSECDPSKKGICPQDGGVAYQVVETPDGGVPDGGTDAGVKIVTKYSGRTCTKTGRDLVGTCANGCDPLAAQAKDKVTPPCEDSQGCYPNFLTGEGNCFGISGTAGDDGTACRFINACDPGFACTGGKCRKLCGGPKNIGCPMGQTCKDLSMQVKKTTLGLCSP